MSGHSKWATTKRQKGVVDAKRSSLFTKLSKNIAIAAREGADPKMNFKLRIAVDQARTMSMPKDNIERAIARGSGTGAETQLEEALYEGFGPQGVAVLVSVVTDNKNRASSEVRHIFSSHGGKFGASVAWMFELRGVITLKITTLTPDQELAIIDLSIIDLQPSDTGMRIITSVESLQRIKESIDQLGIEVAEIGTEYIPKDLIQPDNAQTVIDFLDELDELDDVGALYTNAHL